MKKLILFAVLFSSLKNINAENSIKVNSTIQNITVFRKGAEVNNIARTTVPTGMSEVILQNLPANINDKSIQVACNSDLIILSVTFQLNYLGTKEKFPEYKRLEDSLEMLNDNFSNINNQITVLQEEEAMLKENRRIGGVNTGVSTAELKNATLFFSTRMTEIKTQITALSKKQKKLQEQITRIQNQINSFNQKLNQPGGEIVLQVSSKANTNAVFHFSYLANEAGWNPFYDLRAENIKSPIQLIYKANVFQNTGIDWKNVNLTISTGNPIESGTNPVMNIWWLDFYISRPAYSRNYAAPMMQQSIKKTEAEADMMGLEETPPPATVNNYTSVSETQFAAEFKIDLPYTIPSDGKTHIVAMKEYSLPAIYQYYAVPKLDKDAFLLAKITDWEKLSLLSGTANIFFDGAYVGQTQINTSNTKDTLDFSLGRDKKIIIKREKIKDFTSSKIVSLNKKETYAYEISVRNTKNEAIDIEIFDQIPVSQNKDIVVELEEFSNAEVNNEKGELKWNYKIEPTKSASFKFIYSVKYPKERQIPRW